MFEGASITILKRDSSVKWFFGLIQHIQYRKKESKKMFMSSQYLLRYG
jgi:hypothetical protein